MLVLTVTKEAEGLTFSFGGRKKAIVRILDIRGDRVRVGIDAPHSVAIGRENPNDDTPKQPWETPRGKKSRQ